MELDQTLSGLFFTLYIARSLSSLWKPCFS